MFRMIFWLGRGSVFINFREFALIKRG